MMQLHPIDQELVDKAARSHNKNRNPEGITDADVDLARLYCYAFRRHTIGTFHATRQALWPGRSRRPRPPRGDPRLEALGDLANQAMETIPADFRAGISVLFRYHTGTARVIDSLQRDYVDSDGEVDAICRRFRRLIEGITAENGIRSPATTPPQTSGVHRAKPRHHNRAAGLRRPSLLEPGLPLR